MVRKYVFGKPIKTGAVVRNIPESTEKLTAMYLRERKTELCYPAGWRKKM